MYFSDKPVFKALWENYNKCQFVDTTVRPNPLIKMAVKLTRYFILTGDILFYRDKRGQAIRRPPSIDIGFKSEVPLVEK